MVPPLSVRGSITRQDVIDHFHMSQERAARALGVSLNSLKRRATELGITHWPYKQLRGLAKLEKHQRTFPGDYKRISTQRLEDVREDILQGVLKKLPDDIYRAERQMEKRLSKSRM